MRRKLLVVSLLLLAVWAIPRGVMAQKMPADFSQVILPTELRLSPNGEVGAFEVERPGWDELLRLELATGETTHVRYLEDSVLGQEGLASVTQGAMIIWWCDDVQFCGSFAIDPTTGNYVGTGFFGLDVKVDYTRRYSVGFSSGNLIRTDLIAPYDQVVLWEAGPDHSSSELFGTLFGDILRFRVRISGQNLDDHFIGRITLPGSFESFETIPHSSYNRHLFFRREGRDYLFHWRQLVAPAGAEMVVTEIQADGSLGVPEVRGFVPDLSAGDAIDRIDICYFLSDLLVFEWSGDGDATSLLASLPLSPPAGPPPEPTALTPADGRHQCAAAAPGRLISAASGGPVVEYWSIDLVGTSSPVLLAFPDAIDDLPVQSTSSLGARHGHLLTRRAYGMTGEPERTYLFAASLETGESFVVDGFPAEIRKSGWYGNRAEYEAVIGGSVELRSTAVPAPSSSFLVASWPDSPILNEGLGNWITWRYRDRRYFVYGEELDPGFRWVLVQDPVELFASGFENGVEEWSWVFP